MHDGSAIQTFGLSRHFGTVRAVEDLHLHVPSRSVYGFLGPNGAGKTTTIRLLLGLLRPSAGDIRLLGQPLHPSSRQALARQIGALVEMPSLYPHLTGYENLRVTQQLTGLPRARIGQVLAVVHLEHDAHRLVREYSSGMRQRLGLALALLSEPALLILDEPTNGLDPAGIREMRDLIRRLPEQRGLTVFLSSHLLGEVEQLATHVGIIGRGRLLFQGPLRDLQRRRRERAVLEVDQPSAALVALRGAGWHILEAEAGRLVLDVSDRTDTARVVAELVRAGIAIYQVRLEQPSLEELFLDLTGQHSLAAPEVAA
jgi:ABC-2 type transport system ATP-binding protein